MTSKKKHPYLFGMGAQKHCLNENTALKYRKKGVSSMPMSNEAITKALMDGTAVIYKSIFTGEEIDEGIEAARNIQPFLAANVIVPYAVFTGDTLSSTITTLTKDMWLKEIILYCRKAFSVSSSEINYEISTGNGQQLVSIPNSFMRDAGSEIIYTINRSFAANTSFNMVCTGTRAFGEVVVKLVFC